MKKTYPAALREEAVKLVLTQGLSIEQAAASVSIPKGRSPIRWQQPVVARQGRHRQVVVRWPSWRPKTRLRKELAATKMERDIVKKAAAYFAQESLPSTRG